MNTDHVYYIILIGEDGLYSDLQEEPIFSSEKEAIDFAEEKGYTQYMVHEWSVD